MLRRARVIPTLVSVACLMSSAAATADDFEALRLNQIQLIGTHNSYHVRPGESDSDFRTRSNRALGSLDYTHATLDVQLDRGVRSLALDLHYTADGFEVFHIPRIDEGSTCRDFDDGLELISRW